MRRGAATERHTRALVAAIAAGVRSAKAEDGV